MLCCFVSPNISSHRSAVLTIYGLHPAKQRHLPLRKPLASRTEMSSASSVAFSSSSCTTVSSSASSCSPPRSRNSEHTTFYDLEDTIHSHGAESRTILLPITPNHTPVLDWLGSARSYILIARLKAAEKVHRANMSKDAITANATLHPSWKG